MRGRHKAAPALASTLSQSAYTEVLLIVTFMLLLVSQFLKPPPHHFLPMKRYRSQNATPLPEALREDAMMLTITRDGTFYFGNTKIAMEELPERIAERVQRSSRRQVFFVVDERAKYHDVSLALDEVRRAEILEIAFLAEVPILHK